MTAIFDDLSQYNAEDLAADYAMMLEDFGQNDVAVILYKRELEKRNAL